MADKNLTIMRGPSGAGKSFVAAQILNPLFEREKFICSTDDFFKTPGQLVPGKGETEPGYEFDPSKLPLHE